MGLPALAMGLLVLVSLPELWATTHPPEGQVYRLSFWTPQDVAPYLAAMKDAASSSSWLVNDRLTPEPHSPTLLYPLYVLVAKATVVLPLSMETAFFLFREVSRLALLGCLYLFIATFVPASAQRRPAFFVVLGSSGMAFLWLLVGAVLSRPSLVEEMGVEWRYLETNTFIALYSYPHLILALACLLLIASFWFRYLQGSRQRDLGGFALAVVLLGLANPFSLVPVGAVVATRTIIDLPRRRLGRRQLAVALTLLVTATPFLAFHYLTFVRDPFWSTVYGSQNQPHLLTPPLPALLASFGPVLPLAGVGGAALVRQRTPRGGFVVLWAVVLLALMLAPLPYQRRFGLGVHPVLALLAFAGMSLLAAHPVWRSLPSLRRAVIRDVLGVGLFASTLGAYLLVALGSWGQGPLAAQSFASAATVEAGRWLAAHSGGQDVTLGDRRTCNTLVRHIQGRTVYAHDIATLAPERKRREVEVFYQRETSDSWRRSLLQRYGVTFVVHGPREKELGGFEPGGASYLQEVYEANGVRLYAVLKTP